MSPLAQAITLHQQGQHDASRQACVLVLQRDPGNLQALALHGTVCALLGRRQEALTSFLKFSERQPRHALSRYMLGNLYRESGELAKAVESYRLAVRHQPNFPDAWNNLGMMQAELGDTERAIESYQRCLQFEPAHPLACYNLGNARQQQRQFADACEWYQRAGRVNSQDVNLQFNHGNALLALGQCAEALQHYQIAHRLAPDHPQLNANMAVALRRMGRLQAAQDVLEQMLAHNPEDVSALITLANVRQDMTDVPGALSALRLAAALAPRLGPEKAPLQAEVQFNLGNVLMDARQPEAALAAFEVCNQLAPDNAAYVAALAAAQAALWQTDGFALCWTQLMQLWASDAAVPVDLILEHSEDPAMHRQAAERQVRELLNRHRLMPMPMPLTSYEQHGRIRIGYLSPDFGLHPVGLSLVEVLEHADQSRFELVGLSLQQHPDTTFRQRLMSAFNDFHELGAMELNELIGFIRGLKLDLLIDLAGHTTGARPLILAARLARVQAGYLGYPGTLGGSWLDYLIADEVVIPSGSELHYAEQIMRVPGSFFPTDTTVRLEHYPCSRTQEALPESAFVFCNFAPPKRITATMMHAWLSILRDAPGAVLWLNRPLDSVMHRMQAMAMKMTVDPQRLVFARFADDRNEHIARHQLADLYLDTYPYNAHSTGRDALYAGLPLLTRCGATYPSRVATSLLSALGLPELITHSADEYVSKALGLFHDRVALQSLRQRLASPAVRQGLFDSPRLMRHLEGLYVEMLALANHSRGTSG